MIQYATGPRPKKSPKPKKHKTAEGEDIFYSYDLDLFDYQNNEIQLFGWDDAQGFLLLADQEIILEGGQILTILNGCVSSIS